MAQMTLHGVWSATGSFSAIRAPDLRSEATTETSQSGLCLALHGTSWFVVASNYLARDVCGDPTSIRQKLRSAIFSTAVVFLLLYSLVLDGGGLPKMQ